MKIGMIVLAGLAMAGTVAGVYGLTFKIHNDTNARIFFVGEVNATHGKDIYGLHVGWVDMGQGVTNAGSTKVASPTSGTKNPTPAYARFDMGTFVTVVIEDKDFAGRLVRYGLFSPEQVRLGYLHPKDGKQYRIYFDTDGKTLKVDETDCESKDCL